MTSSSEIEAKRVPVAAMMVPVPAAAAMLGIGESTAYDLIGRGEFPVTVRRVGKAWRIPRSELEVFCSGTVDA